MAAAAALCVITLTALFSSPSASTPIIASILALVNEERFKLGKSSLGFFNPLFYEMVAQCPQCFHTVAAGNNKCTNMACCSKGFSTASTSTNAVTGAGTPNVQEWIKFLSAK